MGNTYRRLYLAQDELMERVKGAFYGGGNVLFEGPPGTGKTELVKMILQEAEKEGIPTTVVNINPQTGPLELLERVEIRKGDTRGEWSELVKTLSNSGVAGIDELDKGGNNAFAALAPLVQGNVLYSSYGSDPNQVEIRGTLIATANNASKLPEELLDRFEVVNFPDIGSKSWAITIKNAYLLSLAELFGYTGMGVLKEIYRKEGREKEAELVLAFLGRDGKKTYKTLKLTYYVPFDERDIGRIAEEFLDKIQKKITEKGKYNEIVEELKRYVEDDYFAFEGKLVGIGSKPTMRAAKRKAGEVLKRRIEKITKEKDLYLADVLNYFQN